MNLLDKNKGLGALVLGLFLFISCEENGPFGLNGDDVAPVEFSSTDISVTSSVVLLDSIRSSGVSNWLVGNIDDPVFGRIKGTAYSRLAVNGGSIFQISNEAEFDSIRLHLTFNYELDTSKIDPTWGFELVSLGMPVTDTLHITSDNVPIAMGEDALTLASADIDVITLDSTYLVDVDQDWGFQLFEMLRDNDVNVQTQEAFEAMLNGLALRSREGADVNNMRGVEISVNTNITMYYRGPSATGDIDRQFTHELNFHTVPSFYGLEADRTGTPTAELEQFSVEVEPTSGKRYIQSGTGIVTKIDISGFRDLLTDDPRIINLAEMVVGPIDDLGRVLSPPPALNLLLTDERNTRISDRGTFRAIQADGANPIDVRNPVNLIYDPETRTYRGSITSYLRAYFGGTFRRDELFLYPNNMNSGVNGISFDPEDVKITIIFSELQ